MLPPCCDMLRCCAKAIFKVLQAIKAPNYDAEYQTTLVELLSWFMLPYLRSCDATLENCFLSIYSHSFACRRIFLRTFAPNCFSRLIFSNFFCGQIMSHLYQKVLKSRGHRPRFRVKMCRKLPCRLFHKT